MKFFIPLIAYLIITIILRPQTNKRKRHVFSMRDLDYMTKVWESCTNIEQKKVFLQWERRLFRSYLERLK